MEQEATLGRIRSAGGELNDGLVAGRRFVQLIVGTAIGRKAAGGHLPEVGRVAGRRRTIGVGVRTLLRLPQAMEA